MIKQLVQWEGLNGKPRSKTFYFHLTKFEVAGEMELEILHARFLKFQEEVINDSPRDMTPPEVREMLDMVKTIVRYAYGEYRETPEGGEMWKDKQDPDVWNRFEASGGFDGFIWWLFEDGNRANSFMVNIWPDEYKKGVSAEMVKQQIQVDTRDDMGLTVDPSDAPDDGIPSLEDAPDISDAPDDELKPWTELTKDEIDAMGDDEFQELINRSSNGKNVPYQLLAIAMQRTGQTGGTEQ